jgi:enediyne biosynthesis protein E4
MKIDSTWLRFPKLSDPRIPVAGILFIYLILGMTVLGFNRSPLQVTITVATAVALDMMFHRFLVGGKPLFPFSALITGMGLSILINYAHGYWLAAVPPLFAIASKYLVTYKGRHFYNPALFGVVACLLFMDGMISDSPAYQWGGSYAVAVFIITLAVFFFVLRIDRITLIVSFIFFYSIGLFVRAWLTRWHMPMETWLMGAVTSPALYLFLFFMITDPQTSPPSKKMQVLVALAIASVDFVLHLKEALSTLFYAAFLVATLRFIWLHLQALRQTSAEFKSRVYFIARRWLVLGGSSVFLWFGINGFTTVNTQLITDFKFEEVSASNAGITSRQGNVLEQVDPRISHIAKWMLSVGDAVAVADIDNDGLQDLFVTYPLKDPADRAALYRNLGNFQFERIEIAALRAVFDRPKTHGLPSGAMFLDYDNDGDQDLVVTVGYGKTRLFKNLFAENGKVEFIDVADRLGLGEYTISVAANAADYDHDGKLDLIIANVMNPNLRAYDQQVPLNIFKLPEPAFEGDRRMFDFMHRTWHNANNGGGMTLWRNGTKGFEKITTDKLGLTGEQRWTTSIGFGDLNGDGWPDLYASNDFGPDQLLINQRNGEFKIVRGKLVGSIGRDTYKGMNVSFADFDNNGFSDIYVSNVHEKLQAEGSLLWMNGGKPEDPSNWSDRASKQNALNEKRFGWGAATGDIDGDGTIDILQANGMVDNVYDPLYADCPDYWYWNDKIALTRPDIHGFADRWADLRGRCIFPFEKNRVYLNKGQYFVDVAEQIGWNKSANSRGVAIVDLDNDGALDVLVTHQFAPLSIYRNVRRTNKNNWLGLKLQGDGESCNRDAIGTKVLVDYQVDGQTKTQSRELMTINGFSAQSDRRIVFGLGKPMADAASLKKVNVNIHWCGRPVADRHTLAMDQYHNLKQAR